MKSIFSSFFKSAILSSLVLIAFGILLIVQSEATIITISYIIGAILIALGVIAGLQFFKKKGNKSDLDIIYGVVCIILGIIVIKNPEAIAGIIPFVIGFIIIVNSATKLQYGLELKKEKNSLWISTIVLSIIMAVCGLVLIFNPFEGAIILTRVVGIFIVLYAVLDIISTIVIKNTYNQIHNAIQDGVKDAEIIEEKTESKKENSKKGDKK